MPEMKDPLTLAALQAYQHALCVERGWDKATQLETWLLFSEEVGELGKAIRHRLRIFVEKGRSFDEHELASEFSDVLSYLLELANQFGIDLEAAFRRKEAINAARAWEGSSGA